MENKYTCYFDRELFKKNNPNSKIGGFDFLDKTYQRILENETKNLNNSLEKIINERYGSLEEYLEILKKNTESDLNKTINEREGRYGSLEDNTKISQELKSVVRNTKNWNKMENYKKEAIESILCKIARIPYGDTNYVDTWKDIGGYAQAVINIIERNNEKV